MVQVIIIVVTMGAWDFVTGILVGIILACVNFVVQTSQKSAIRATFSGGITGSTVRRPPIQQQFLHEAGQQTLIMKLGGYLFFGTIVNVENRMRGLIEEDAFRRQPIRFLILDFSRVYGLDFSAAEAFTRINRILRKRHVQTTISGLNVEGDVGKSYRTSASSNLIQASRSSRTSTLLSSSARMTISKSSTADRRPCLANPSHRIPMPTTSKSLSPFHQLPHRPVCPITLSALRVDNTFSE